jgi:hypothetical protein
VLLLLTSNCLCSLADCGKHIMRSIAQTLVLSVAVPTSALNCCGAVVRAVSISLGAKLFDSRSNGVCLSGSAMCLATCRYYLPSTSGSTIACKCSLTKSDSSTATPAITTPRGANLAPGVFST